VPDSAPPNILETATYRVTFCHDCDVPGYLIVEPMHASYRISELSVTTRNDLGSLLGQVEAAVLAETGAEHVYVLRFSEGMDAVHFHVFPRTRELARLWRESMADGSDGEGINGPLLFAWARIRYYVNHPDRLSARTLSTATRIASRLRRGTTSQR